MGGRCCDLKKIVCCFFFLKETKIQKSVFTVFLSQGSFPEGRKLQENFIDVSLMVSGMRA